MASPAPTRPTAGTATLKPLVCFIPDREAVKVDNAVRLRLFSLHAYVPDPGTATESYNRDWMPDAP